MEVTVEHLGAVQFQIKTRGHSIVSGTRVRATCEKVKDPVARMTNFVIEVDAPIELTKDQRKGLDQAVANCLVHNALTHAPTISLKVVSLVLGGKSCDLRG
jgi:uncharacterized OsmC-like protein